MSSTWVDSQDEAAVEAAIAHMRADDTVRSVYIEGHAQGDARFALWLRLVDRVLSRRYGLTHADLADWTWRDAYLYAVSPRDAAMEALAADDLGALMLAGEEQ